MGDFWEQLFSDIDFVPNKQSFWWVAAWFLEKGKVSATAANFCRKRVGHLLLSQFSLAVLYSITVLLITCT